MHYAGIALARLGAQVRVVTRVRARDADELLAALKAEGVELHALPSRATTGYLNEYSGMSDRHTLESLSDPIRSRDLPEEWRTADLVQLGPLHRRDLHPELASGLHGLIGLDVQGFFRESPSKGARRLRRFLPHVQVLQVSHSDAEALLRGEAPVEFVRRWELSELILTRGPRGATLVTACGSSEIPARAVSGGDPVGAGDVFLAAYLWARVQGRAPAEAAGGAAELCAAKIELGEVPCGTL